MRKVQEFVKVALKKDEAIAFLMEKGVLIGFDEKEKLFHGRVNTNDEKFFVDSNFDNSGRTLGHYNNNAIPGLHASNYKIAQRYANKRMMENAVSGAKMGRIEVHQIAPICSGLKIVNYQKLMDIDDLEPSLLQMHISQEEINELKKQKLSPEEMKKVKDAIKTITATHTVEEVMPKLFEFHKDQKILKDLFDICAKNSKKNKPYVLDDDLEKYITKYAKGSFETEEKIRAISGAVNVFQLLKEDGNIQMLVSKLQSDIDFTDDMSLNLDFFKAFLGKENIVGIKQKIWVSKVINENNFDDYFFFDTQRINTNQVVHKMEQDKKKQTKESKPQTRAA